MRKVRWRWVVACRPVAVTISRMMRWKQPQLGRRRVLELPQMVEFHTWLDGKRLARQSCCFAPIQN
jgi:hypothetical protein